jgi:two-component system, OmpR family, phosphate regulon sensor histidine kinase PhoR
MQNNTTHLITDSLNQGVVILNKNNEVEFINKRLKFWLSLNKVDSKSFLGKKDKEFYEKFKNLLTETKNFSKLVTSIQGKKNLVNNAIDLEMKTKLYKYLHATTTPIYDNNEGYVGRVWVFEDITKEKNIDKMKTEFISIASHQLRTPVTIIRGYLSMLTDGSYLIEDKEIKEYVEAAKQGSDRLVELIEDLLNISKLDIQQIQVSKQKENLEKVFNEILSMHLPEIQKKGIQFEKKYLFQKDETFLIDLAILINIINNLVENAIKYTPEKGKIAIKVEILEKEKRALSISVKDSGMGIPEEEQEKIFEKFFRANNVKDKDFSGTGIGLYYVTRLLELLNGKISLSSKLGEGTEFKIEIPEV